MIYMSHYLSHLMASIVIFLSSFFGNALTPHLPTIAVASDTPATQQTTQTGMTATFDESALNSTSTDPILTGTALGTNSFCVFVGTSTTPAQNIQDVGLDSNYVWIACEPQEIGAGPVRVTNGHWSVNTTDDVVGKFSNGTYGVALYNESGTNFGALLAHGTLMISGLSPVPTCTITATPASAKVGQSVTVSWTSQNATQAAWLQYNSVIQSNPVAALSFQTGNIGIWNQLESQYSQPSLNGSGTVTAQIDSVGNTQVPGHWFVGMAVRGTGGSDACGVAIPINP